MGRKRAVQHRTKDSAKLAQERSDLRPVVVEVLESREKVALYHIGADEDDQDHSEEYVLDPIDPAAQYRSSAVRSPPPWRGKEKATGGEHHDLGQEVASSVPVKKNG